MINTRNNIVFLIMLAGVFGLGFITPWWSGAGWILLFALFGGLTTRQSIFSGGFALAIVWILMARFTSLHDEAGIITKTGTLLGGLSHQLMMLVTLLIAFITGLLSGWFGGTLGNVFFKKAKE